MPDRPHRLVWRKQHEVIEATADLDRNGAITQTDYDISIADDGKSSSGGVGEAGLFSRGVRNSVGYCGYVFNEDSGLYTVRFRTYSPALGRWLERDPAGYVDGMGLYEYVRGGAIGAVDPWGLCACDDGTIRPERFDDHHDDRQKFEQARPPDQQHGKQHLVPEEFQDDKYGNRWHDHLGKAQKEWTGKTRAVPSLAGSRLVAHLLLPLLLPTTTPRV